MNFRILKAEIDNDPLTINYATKTDEEIVASLNSPSRTVNVSSLTGTEVLNAIEKSAFDALSDAQRKQVWDVLHLGSINPFGIEADIFISIFGGGSATITALSAIRKRAISRGAELGLGVVRVSDISKVGAI